MMQQSKILTRVVGGFGKSMIYIPINVAMIAKAQTTGNLVKALRRFIFLKLNKLGYAKESFNGVC